jgi:hypothetical protein
MYEYSKVMNRIEKLIDQLPYSFVKIEVELKDQMLVLEKQKSKPIGFTTDKG